MKKGIAEKISDFIVKTGPGDIPESALTVAALAIQDFVGVTLAGSTTEIAAITSAWVKEINATPASSVIGKGYKTSPHLAVLANGTNGHAIDYDDFSFECGVHPSVVIAPVVLAIAENLGRSGLDVLSTYVIAFEVCARISSPIAQSSYALGWHTTSSVGIFAATTAACRLLKLDPKQIGMAFGIVASMASGLRVNFGTMTKPLHAGIASANGILAASLGKLGFTANVHAIESYAKVFGASEQINWDDITSDLGERFIIEEGICFKPFPSCGGTLNVIDAALYLKSKYNPDPAMIDEIVLGVGPFENAVLIHNPKTGLEGKFSLEYCVCRALLDGRISLSDFTDERVNQTEVRNMMKRVKCTEQYRMAVMGIGASGLNVQSVTVKIRDGTVYFRESSMASDMRLSPAIENYIDNKFMDCSSLVLESHEIEKSLCLLKRLKKLDTLQELMEVIRGGRESRKLSHA